MLAYFHMPLASLPELGRTEQKYILHIFYHSLVQKDHRQESWMATNFKIEGKQKQQTNSQKKNIRKHELKKKKRQVKYNIVKIIEPLIKNHRSST